MNQKKPLSELRRGITVFAVLAGLTAIEFWLGTSQVPSIFLWIIAILKAALVLVYFMHVGRLSGSQGESE